MGLIDGDKAISTAVTAAIDWHRLANPQYSIAYCIGEALRALPTIDIVRCRECKHRTTETIRGKQRYVCEYESADPYEMNRWADRDDWFCADGERRNENG